MATWLGALLLSCVAGSGWAQSAWQPAPAATKADAPPQVAVLEALPAGSLSRWQRSAGKTATWTLVLPDGSRRQIALTARIAHPNGDVSYSGSLQGVDGRFGVLLTEGAEASFGRYTTPQGDYYFEAWGERGWLVDLAHPALQRGVAAEPQGRRGGESAAAAAAKPLSSVIDLLVLYSDGFAARYPGSASQTRVQHLVALANQIAADSGLPLGIRLVGAERSAYPDSEGSNDVLLNRMRQALQAQPSHPALAGLRERRQALGADLVSFLWPADIETRGSCGIARLLGQGPDYAVNVVNDGFTSWSLCGDEVLMHEIGHNLGAEHQNGANSGRAGFGTAHVLPGRLHTLMGSFGTGKPDRGRRLDRFSNPTQRCGGGPCGLAGVADNARRIRGTMAVVAAYQPARSALPLPQELPPRDPDSDGDGVADSEDAFPFEPAFQRDRDGDGVADELDAFADDPAESADRDGDRIGDQADPDRDNDGVANAEDAFPADRSESRDSDRDGVGDQADAFDQDPREWRDGDGDGVGDHADSDRDGDGSADVAAGGAPGDADLLVISSGNDRVLRLRGDSGRYAGVEIAESFLPQTFGFQSALAWNPARKQLYALAATELRRYRRDSGQRESVAVGYGGGPLPALPSAFPAGLAVDAQGVIFLADEPTRALARLDATTAEPLPGGAFGSANFLVDAPRGLCLGASGRLWVLQRSGLLIEVETASGLLMRSIDPRLADGSGVGNATALAFDGARDALLIADAASDRVLRVAASGARPAELLIPPGSGGLQAPAGLALGPDGQLYVSSAGDDRVLRYRAADGGFIDALGPLPPGRLREPRGLLFAPRVADRYPDDAARQLRPQAGAWYDPQRAGQGFDLQLSGETLSLVWYTFDAAGEPTWYLASGRSQGSRMQAPWLRFVRAGGTSTASEVGQVRLQLHSETAATLHWQLGAQQGEQALQPLWLGGTEESAFPTAAWYPPAESGWGLSLARGGDVHTAIAFLYDPAGQPTWVAGATVDPAQPLRFAMTRYRSRSLCPGCAGAASAEAEAAGELRMRVLGDNHAEVDSELRATGLDWPRQATAFQRLTDSPSDPAGNPRY